MDVLFERSSLNFKRKVLEKQLRKVIAKLQALKSNFLHVIFKDFAKSLSNFDHDFFLKDCFPKPKLLLAANMLIYLNTSTNRHIKNSRHYGHILFHYSICIE